jgi:small subunit ribosomal protein S17
MPLGKGGIVRYPLGKLIGYVKSTKMDKSITVNIPYFWFHPKYNIPVRRRTRLMAHDEYEMCAEGDMVRLRQSRPLSKHKSHVVDAILGRADGSEPPATFPNV